MPTTTHPVGDSSGGFEPPHVCAWWNDLDDAARRRLSAQLEAIDRDQLRRLWECARAAAPTEGDSPAERARRATPPSRVVRLDDLAARPDDLVAARREGERLLANGRIGAIIVAGGEGTRLQFPHPKGMYPIGPVSGRTLFQWLAEQILVRARRAGRPIPVYVMTSDATHDETAAHFADRASFGLDPSDVRFFRQGTMPVVGWDDGGLLMASRDDIARSPDGHGGLVAALARESLLDDMRRRGVEHLFYMQVDNPTVVACDPVFLGLHALHGSELSTKVVAKVSAAEKMGVVCDVDGKTQIVEYSDMPPEIAARLADDGSLLHWAGNTATHAFSREFLERLSADADSLPFHAARKHVPYVGPDGALVEPKPPAPPNACKFERFIFDALPLARATLVVEADRAREFNPVKDREGANSPATARAALSALGRTWLQTAGIEPPENAAIEIAPTAALDADDLRRLDPSELRRRMRESTTAGTTGWIVE